ncbi:3-phosphoinositide-dependent protein kinase 1-like isoform X2 [Dermacentor silvarum]|uniref:3-phosphoinositide-dependent protein kinase 1-like isoform X2 n=1 Tax=Dermacentor silvarum TaxID=543639 RepID=UPI0021018DF9|nr:3-phosphoinositide-dependent protein kinase 1-like isoform X2 [Dermacentor silvarum]
MSAAAPSNERSVKESAETPPQGTAAMPTPVTGAAASTGAAAALSNNVAAAATSKEGGEEAKQPAKMCANDFIFGKLIGEGSFSMVYLAKEIRTNKEYAIKVCYKQHIIREKKQRAIMREKQILRILSARPHPFFIRLHSTFHDANKLYFVVTYAKNGELLPHIVKYGSFDVDVTRFYTAEIISALEHLHSLGIVHRDLKPENILLDERMHIQITDFGSAKIISRDFCDEVDIGEIELNGHNSFVGTAQYVSPEMLSDKSCSPSTDLWALGCIVYQMISGLPPFRASNEYLTFQKILKLKYEFPDGFNPVVRDLVENLLVLDPNQRLGAATTGGYPTLKQHEFFTEVRWEKLPEMDPPKMLPFLPGTSSNEELRSHYCVPDDLEPGLDDKQMTRLLGLAFDDDAPVSSPTVVPQQPQQPQPQQPQQQQQQQQRTQPQQRISRTQLHILDFGPEEHSRRLQKQSESNPYHKFVQGNLILKQGLVDKRKGLFARRRMLLLTTGPHLYYVDPQAMVLKGEIPWSTELRPEPKNFKTFFVHTPNRTYYLEDPEGYALAWCKAIEEVRKATYNQADDAS